ncbi:MAG: peptidase S10 [Flavobacteriales bacterium]|nr:peptidase S10 [Flavobacteriales bacterium]
MKTYVLSALLVASALSGPAHAQDSSDTAKAKKEKSENIDLPPLPADKTVKQSATIGGKTISYEATVGSIPVRNEKGKKIAEVVYTAYVVPGSSADRPVMFAFNGGPGASSVYLNLGAVGPKRVQFGAEGDVPSDAGITVDNPNSWLDFTDMVFIDPVGTGFSRSLVDPDEARKEFYSTEADITYLSRIVYDWLLENKRMRSPKYVMGESYGGYRAPRIAYALQTSLGVGVNGLVMVSPYLDPAAVGDGTALSPLPWMIDLPSMAAAKLEREGRLDPQTIAAVEDYTRTEFVTDLLKGPKDVAARRRLIERVSGYTGLDTGLVAKLDGRVDVGTFLRESHRTDKKIGSVYDSNVTAWDPFPGSAYRRSGDPILDALIAPTTSAMVDLVTRVVGWDIKARYNALSEEVNNAWDSGEPRDSPVSDLRKAIANDPRMKVMIVHGYDDLACPYFGSRLIVDQMPSFGVEQRVKLSVYPGGHMFYSRPGSSAAFKTDGQALFQR